MPRYFRIAPRRCEICEHEYQPEAEHQKYCSIQCYDAAYRRRRRLRKANRDLARMPTASPPSSRDTRIVAVAKNDGAPDLIEANIKRILGQE